MLSKGNVTVSEVKRNLAQPLGVDPGMPGGGERVGVDPGKLMVLEQELRIPHVPPNIRIIDISVVHRIDELNRDEDQREDAEKGRGSTKPALGPSAKTEWRCRSDI